MEDIARTMNSHFIAESIKFYKSKALSRLYLFLWKYSISLRVKRAKQIYIYIYGSEHGLEIELLYILMINQHDVKVKDQTTTYCKKKKVRLLTK